MKIYFARADDAIAIENGYLLNSLHIKLIYMKVSGRSSKLYQHYIFQGLLLTNSRGNFTLYLLSSVNSNHLLQTESNPVPLGLETASASRESQMISLFTVNVEKLILAASQRYTELQRM